MKLKSVCNFEIDNFSAIKRYQNDKEKTEKERYSRSVTYLICKQMIEKKRKLISRDYRVSIF